jgi:hypothetical protein
MPSPASKANATLAAMIPGGIKPTDHWHIRLNDGTCSRCRKEVPDDDVPLMLFGAADNEGDCDMLIYCEACLAGAEGRA